MARQAHPCCPGAHPGPQPPVAPPPRDSGGPRHNSSGAPSLPLQRQQCSIVVVYRPRSGLAGGAGGGCVAGGASGSAKREAPTARPPTRSRRVNNRRALRVDDLAVEGSLEGGHTAADVDVHCSGADSHRRGDLGIGQVRVIAQDQRLSLRARKRAKSQSRASPPTWAWRTACGWRGRSARWERARLITSRRRMDSALSPASGCRPAPCRTANADWATSSAAATSSTKSTASWVRPR